MLFLMYLLQECKKGDKVSVIIPVYNGEKYLRQCLDSVCAQTIFEVLKIILINDGSTDGTRKICDEYANKYKNIHVVHQENKGLVATRKLGVRLATSKYITFVDADDWIDCQYIENLLEAMETSNCDLVISDMKYEFSDRSERFEFVLPQGTYRGDELIKFKSKYLYSDHFFGFGSCICVWGKLYKTEEYRPFQDAVPDRLKMGEDVAATIPYVMNLKGAVTQVTNVFYHYRQTETSMVHEQANPYRECETELLYKCLDKALSNNSLYKRLNYYKASMLIGLMKNNYNLQKNFQCKYREIRRLVNDSGNRSVVEEIALDTMAIKYKIFFTLFKMKWSLLLMLIIMLFK